MHDDYTSNLVACLRMARMEFCELIVTANKVAGMYRAKFNSHINHMQLQMWP
jgi:hypothetical protein